MALILLGCAQPRTKVEQAGEADFARYHKLGVAPFSDPRGQGRLMADSVNAGLRKLLYEPADPVALTRILVNHKPNQDSGMSLEALELIRLQTGADAIVLGRMTPDWSALLLTVVETELGEPVLHAVARPRNKKQAAFASADEVVQETLRILAGRR